MNDTGKETWLHVIRQALRSLRHRLMPRPTYADDREDEVVWMLLGGVRRFIDVGANDGLSCSNTAHAAMRGAQGLCFEPNPAAYKALAEIYRWTRRIECVPEGISDQSGCLELRCDGLLSAMPATEDEGLSRLLENYSQSDAPVISVQVSRLGDWLARRPAFQGCDLLSIDVEGHELNVLRGIDWKSCPMPSRALLIETHAGKKGELWRHRDLDAITALLAEHNYCKVAESRNNTVWLHAAHLDTVRLRATKVRFPDYTWLIS